MEALAQTQKSTGEEIQRLISNVKKDPARRKTAAYLEEKIQRLDSLWEEFESVDNEIRADYADRTDHSYFTKDYYTAIKDLYTKHREQMAAQIEPARQQIATGGVPRRNEDSSPHEPHVHEPSRGTRAHGNEGAHNIGSNPLLVAVRKQNVNMQALRRLLDRIDQSIQGQQSKQYYQYNIDAIERQWALLEIGNNEIWELIDDPETTGYNLKEYIELEQRVQFTGISLSEGLAQQTISQSNDTVSNSIAMKMPRIVMPIFDGNYANWRQFHDLFTQMVHNQPMSGCQKMWYLKTNLKGEAEKLIRHLTLSNENYASAWKMLKDRYDNTRLLVTALLNKLTSQPRIVSESAVAIKLMHDTTKETLMGLDNLNISTTNWDPLVLHLLVGKLDRQTHILYEQSLDQPKALQSLSHFLEFLENRFQSLEALGTKGKLIDEATRKTNSGYRRINSLVSTQTKANKCPACTQIHQLFSCPKFLQLEPSNRLTLLRKNNLCINCMKVGHTAANCTSRGCKLCSKKHNSLVHLRQAQSERVDAQQSKPVSIGEVGEQTVALASQETKPQGYVLLSTVIVKLINNKGKIIECRAILDSGSQINLITERMVKKLQLSGTPHLMQVHGIGQAKQQAQKRVSVVMQSRTSGFSTRMEAFIIKQIVPPHPSQSIDTTAWSIPHNIELSDLTFNQPNQVDLLIGAEHFYQLLCVGQVKLGAGLPTLQKTVLGWVVSGQVDSSPVSDSLCCIYNQDEAMNKQLERFWCIEENNEEKKTLTASERKCEEYFTQTTKRNESGQFIVKLPLLKDPSILGKSRDIALRRFLAIERRLERDHELRSQYTAFMEEYEQLGHMQELNINQIKEPHYFIPHHAVRKPDSTTTKLRVVFDASCKTSSNISLNELLATGPTIQDELFTILLRFRLPRFVFTADIQKMYRQILVDEDQRNLQLIMWRNSPNHTIKYYQLNTVTYGTTSAPYLATKCLQRLAQEGSAAYPLGAEVLSRDFYVDDVMSGADSLAVAVEMQQQLRSLLSEGGFTLRKWCANHPHLLKTIAPSDREVQISFNDIKEESIKVLGLIWHPASDSFRIKATLADRAHATKRIVCSDIARIFDPLGIMAPVVITAKLFLQELWSLKIEWDASLPIELHTRWLHFRQGLHGLNDVTFPRHIFSHQLPNQTQLHAFADASQKAYGAAIYIRSINKNKQPIVRLLCAKSRVAPLKQITLPRLELCAAKLAAELTNRIRNDLSLKDKPIYFWTDSEIVLGWINSSSASYQTFVANRIAAIQQLSLAEQWRHVSSKNNPADALTRGLSPEKFKGCSIWFYGPLFLHGSERSWPQPYIKHQDCETEKRRVALMAVSGNKPDMHFICKINHHNSFSKLKRIVAYIIRFISKLRRKNFNSRDTSNATQPLSVGELESALAAIIKVMQEDGFKDEIKLLKQGELAKNSSLKSLAPFLDEREIIRVGGRLEAADIPYDTKHPILLPYSNNLTKLLMTELHMQHLHVGPQTLLSITRQRFWPIKGKTLARSVVQHCVRCSRARPALLSQMMGQLPAHRVQPARPFVNSGVDFCGPVWTHFKIRGKRPQKSYIAVFCCFATKATHLEVVSDLTTRAFIGALRRFMGRRGHCKNIYCDNATNFVGARNELKELKDAIHSESAMTDINSTCESYGTEFHFIPPRAPHFGGLWEAAVKSAKHLLTRTLGNASLTYEELETIIVQIEAILNSRPITAMSSNPNDNTALTPGHFLIGEALTSAVDPVAVPAKSSLTTRLDRLFHLKNEFWKRWSLEYLNELQQRHKWTHASENIQPGTLVIIRDENLKPLQWPLGRIVDIIKGADGFARVANVRIGSKIMRRRIHDLAPLPVPVDDTDTTSVDDNVHTTTHPSEDPPKTAQPDTSSAPIEGSQSQRKRARLSLGHAISAILIVLLVPSINASPLKITPFKGQPALHFENLGTANIIADEWTLIVYYDMSNYWTEVEGFINGTRMLHELCSSISRERSCETITRQLEHLKEEIISNNEMLKPQITRIRRGALNFVGSIANTLFGVLDAEYAEKMSKTIDNVKTNEDYLLALLKNQTSLIDATVNVMKKNQEQINNQFRAIESKVNSLINISHIISMEIHQEKLSLLFTSLAIQSLIVSTNIQRAQYLIMDVLADTHHGQASPQLITPTQLREALVHIRGNLPNNLELAVDPNNFLRLYSLMKIATRVTKKHIIFKIGLPLLSPEKFELLHIIPIPVLINNTFFAIKPSSSYIIIDLHRETYYPLNEQALHSCTAISDEHHICRQTHPMYKRGSTVSSCEVNLLNETPQLPKCEVATIGEEPQWIQMNDPNQWIFALKRDTTIQIVCGINTSTVTLKGSGILNMQENCIIKQRHVTIQGHNIRPVISRMSYTSIGEFIPMAQPTQLTETPSRVQPYRPEMNDTLALQTKINDLVRSELPVQLQGHDVHQFAIGYIAALLAIIVFGWTLWNSRLRHCKHTIRKPIPQPRRTMSTDFSVHI